VHAVPRRHELDAQDSQADGGGPGPQGEVELLEDICRKIAGRSICALGEFSTGSIVRTVPRFRDEFQAHIDGQGCPFPKDFREFR
jgi:hypothetical protein